jgi:hypothetical protein
MKKVLFAVLIAVLFGTILSSSQAIAQAEGAASSGVVMGPIRTQWPIMREASGQWVVLGEVFLYNSGIETAKIDAVTLSVYNAKGDVLTERTYADEEFRDMLLIIAMNRDGSYAQQPAGTRMLESRGAGLGFVAARTDSSLAPAHARVTAQLHHLDSVTADIPLYEYDPGQQTIWPLRFSKESWVAFNTVGSYYHWTTTYETATEIFDSQRFAIDAFQFDPQGNTSNPVNSRNKEDYYAWGEDILSSGSGVVVAVERNIPDQEIGVQDFVNPLGNFVVIRHAPKLYSLYVHMMQNSVIVNVGDQVATGQMIGRVGNSGQTDAPHLHFQFVDAWKERPLPILSALESQGLPALFWNAKVDRLSTVELHRIAGLLPATWDSQVNLNGGTYMLNGSTLFNMDIVTAP